MFGNRGLTLIEVVVAITVLVITFSVLLDLIYRSSRELEYSRRVIEQLLHLDSKVKLGDLEDVEVSKRSLEIYPKLHEREYRYKEVFLFDYYIEK